MRHYYETNDLMATIVLTRLSFLFQRFYAVLDICAKSTVALSCRTCSSLVSLMMEAVAKSFILSYFFETWSSRTLRIFHFSAASNADLPESSGTSFFVNVSCFSVKIVQESFVNVCVYAFVMNPASDRMNNCLDTIGFTKTFLIVSHCDHCSRYCDMTSQASLPLRNAINVTSRNWTDAVLIFFEASLPLNWSISTRACSIWP